jgi:hypothetical protein
MTEACQWRLNEAAYYETECGRAYFSHEFKVDESKPCPGCGRPITFEASSSTSRRGLMLWFTLVVVLVFFYMLFTTDFSNTQLTPAPAFMPKPGRGY